jgi:hypothetical protein
MKVPMYSVSVIWGSVQVFGVVIQFSGYMLIPTYTGMESISLMLMISLIISLAACMPDLNYSYMTCRAIL